MSRATRAVVAVLALAAAGCGARTDELPPQTGLTGAETRWVADYSAWADALVDDLADEEEARLSVIDDPAGYRSTTRPLRGCGQSLGRTVGAGPTPRTEALADRLDGICLDIERAVTGIADAYTSGTDPVGALVTAAEALGRADVGLTAIDALLESLSLTRRILPIAAWPVSDSRIDPDLTAAAEATIEGFDTEIRCWSEREWKQVIEEEEALSNGDITFDSTGAFANSVTREISMQAFDCDVLGRARAENDWRPDDLDDISDLTWALAVLAHEAQHVAGVDDEAETECRGQQHVADIALVLGAPPGDAHALAERGWRDQYPELDPDYRTVDCRDGGPYDLRPGARGTWPWS